VGTQESVVKGIMDFITVFSSAAKKCSGEQEPDRAVLNLGIDLNNLKRRKTAEAS